MAADLAADQQMLRPCCAGRGYSDFVAASRLGADIPFCMHGGRARVTGIGEILQPLPFVAREITLVVPPFGVSTPAVYKAFDSLQAKHDGPNDLEPAAIAVEPRLAQWRDRIREASGPKLQYWLAAGATWWLDGAHPRIHEALSEATVVVTQHSLFIDPKARGENWVTCGAGGGYDEASSCASFCASAYDDVLDQVNP